MLHLQIINILPHKIYVKGALAKYILMISDVFYTHFLPFTGMENEINS